MSSSTVRPCLSIGELADYWTADASPEDVDRIETHIFECASCARLLAEADLMRRSLGRLIRTGGFQAFVTDSVLNQLARDGVRVRTYSIETGGSVQCAVWSDDELMVARLRGDFQGATAVDADMRLVTGEEWAQASDVPVRDGATELVIAFPAAVVRNAPLTQIHLTLRASGSTDVLAQYVFDHRGSHEQPKS